LSSEAQETMSKGLSAEERGRWMKRATYASATVAGLLIASKLLAWIWLDSVSLLASLLDSCLDAVGSLITLFAVRHALEPADDDHRFGHGKAESLAGLAQSMFITGSALFLILEAVSRFVHPKEFHDVRVGVAVMLFSVALTLGLLAFQRMVIRKTQSVAIQADALHYKTDLYMNISVLVALLLAAYGWSGFDVLFALGIAVFILFGAWEIIQMALHDLMDHELSDAERQQIVDMVCAHPQARGIHDLRTRKSGNTLFIQLHLELDDDLLLLDAHSISDDIEANLLIAFPNAEIIVHEDPISSVTIEPEGVQGSA